MEIVEEQSYDALVQRDFIVGEVPGMLWLPQSADRVPLVLIGHGGGRDRTSPAQVGRARRLVAAGFAAAAIDAPGHGDRPRSPYDESEIAAMQAAMAQGRPVGPIVTRYNADIAARAVPEWRAALDALQQLPEIGPDGPVGYYGINMGTAIGVPLVAEEPRITAAVFGQFWYETLAQVAAKVTVPIEFLMQWDDEHIDRQSALALFDAFGSQEKSLHANTGRHKEVPRHEVDSAVRFFTRHLAASA